jgi:hypothetical protein
MKITTPRLNQVPFATGTFFGLFHALHPGHGKTKNGGMEKGSHSRILGMI